MATQKVGGEGVPRNVPHDKASLVAFIKGKIKENPKVTRQAIVDEVGVSVKTIQRTVKEIDHLRYIGIGSNGYWELEE